MTEKETRLGQAADLRKQAEEELRKRDIQFMKLSSWVPGMIYQFTKRPDGTYCVPFTTEAIKDIFGCSPQDVREDFSPIARIILPEDFDKVFGSIEYSAKHLTIWTCEYRVQIPGQSIRWVLGKSTPEKSADGSITWYGFNTDITERKRAEEALQHSEMQYRSLTENSPDLIARFDRQYRHLYVNSTAARAGRYSQEEYVGKTIAQVGVPEQEARKWEERIRTVFETGKIVDVDDAFETPHGLRYFYTKFVPEFASDGSIHSVQSIARDITERKCAEEALRENQARLDLALRSADMGVWHWDIIENKRYFDDHVCHLLGINPATFTGTAEEFIGAVHPDDREMIKAALARTIEQDVLYEPEYHVVWPDGSAHYITARGRLVRDDKGRPLRINGIIWDITERKQAEEELRRMNTFLDSVVENIPNMIFLKDAGDLRFVRFNRAGEDLLGHSREDLLGKSDYDFFPKEQADFFAEKDREVLRGKELVDIPEEPLQTRNKGERTMHTKKVPILNAKGEPEYLLGISEDITERNLIDEALHKNEARLTEAERIGRFGNWDWDATTDTIIWSEEYYLIHGFDPKQSPPGYEEHLKIYTSDSAKRLDAAVKKSMQTGEPYELDLEQIVADGTSIWTTARSEVKRDANGQIIGLRGTAQDITERKRVEEALHDAETRYRLLFEHSPDGIVIIDPATAKPLEFNESAFQHLGYSREEFANLSILDIEVNETPEETRSRIAKVMSDGRADFDTRQHTKQGEIRDIHVTAQITEISGHPVYHCIWRDITQRKQAEQQLQNTLESLRKAFGATIQVMVSAVEARDPYTAGHQIRSADLARAIAMEMRLPQEKIDGIRMAGSIHDIGKLSIPAEILSKPTKLSELEFSLIKEHARKGFEMLKGVESPWPLAEIVYQHHERMDGSGYPRNLKGDDILIEARILAVADVVEAMASHRPYRPGLGIDLALSEIEKNKGIFYDDAVADACLRLFREKGFKLEGT